MGYHGSIQSAARHQQDLGHAVLEIAFASDHSIKLGLI